MRPGTGEQSQAYIRGNYGIYLLDVFGNKELIYRDPEIACQNPIPIRPTVVRPPVVPEQADRRLAGKSAEGTMALINVYDTLTPWPDDIKIKALRIYQIIPMSVPSGEPPHETALREPTAGDSVVLARYVVGTVPVEADGSAYFTVPAQKELFFQALDADGLAVQSMRSATYVQPGEQLVCQRHGRGIVLPICPHRAAGFAACAPRFRRRTSMGRSPFSYPRLVQPVLDRHCVSCHQDNAEGDGWTAGHRQGTAKWYASYQPWPKYGFWSYGQRHRTTPGQFGAHSTRSSIAC